jgi:hypothetical protein
MILFSFLLGEDRDGSARLWEGEFQDLLNIAVSAPPGLNVPITTSVFNHIHYSPSSSA